MVVARADAELALEGAGEIREIVEADGVGDLFDECAWMGWDFARRSRPPLARQIKERSDAPDEITCQHRLHQQIPDPDAQCP